VLIIASSMCIGLIILEFRDSKAYSSSLHCTAFYPSSQASTSMRHVLKQDPLINAHHLLKIVFEMHKMQDAFSQNIPHQTEICFIEATKDHL